MAKILAMAKSGFGKALKNGTGVLTPKGYVPIESLSEGDEVMNTYGGVSKVEGVYPQEDVHNIYKVYLEDGTMIPCNGEHMWTVSISLKGGICIPATVTTQQIMHIYASQSGKRRPKFFNIVLPDACAYSEKVYSVDPYTLGVLIGSGYVYNGIMNIQNDFNQTVRKHVLSNLVLPDSVQITGLTPVNKYLTPYTFYNPAPVKDFLEPYGLNEVTETDVFIPEEYLYGSPEQRTALLKGFTDSCGTSDGKCTKLYMKSKRLCENLIRLIQELGIYVQSFMDTDSNGTCVYKIKIKPYRNTKKILNVIYTEELSEMTCIKVSASDSLFLTLGCTPTHNTMSWAGREKYGIKGLDPKETFVIQCLGKSVPNKEYILCPSCNISDMSKGNRVQVDSLSGMDRFKRVAEMLSILRKSPFRNIVIDDMNYLIQDFYMANAMKGGWDIPKQIGYGMGLIFDAMKDFPEDKNLICFAHYEEYRDKNSDSLSYKFKSIGRMIDEYITPEGKFDIVLFGKSSYDAQTKSALKEYVKEYDGEYPAKDSIGALDSLPDSFPNDMNIIVKAIEEFNDK